MEQDHRNNDPGVDDGTMMNPPKRRKIDEDTPQEASDPEGDWNNWSQPAKNNGASEAHANFWDDKDDLLREVLKYLDVASLVEKKQVCTHWKALCTRTIDQKNGGVPRPFQSRDGLRKAILKYIDAKDNPKDAEKIAASYGWPIGKWDVSNVTSFFSIFEDCSTFNEDISSWNTSNVTQMGWTFYGARRFNQPISQWDTSKVTRMIGMFIGATSFNQPLEEWDVSSVTSMWNMFAGATSFNQSLTDWDVSSVTDMSRMFSRATSFNQSLTDWDVSSTTDMDGMFAGATSFDRALVPWNLL